MLIIFEGGEGVGKTTQIELVYQALVNKNISCLKTREPGGTPLAEELRNLFKKKSNDPPCSLAELYLVSAARAQHVENVIKPALNNKIILCDRFLDSTYVYQHILRKIPKDEIDKVTASILKEIMPTLTFFFHCDKKISEKRRQTEKQREQDRLDSSNDDTHDQIFKGYEIVYQEKYPYPCGKIPTRILIDATKSETEVFNQISSAFKQYLSIEL